MNPVTAISRDPATWMTRIGIWGISALALLSMIGVWILADIDPVLSGLVLAPWMALPVVVYLMPRPSLNLVVIMVGFVSMVGFEEGIQLSEAVYGLYYLGFLGTWLIHFGVARRDRICPLPEDKALMAFMVLITLTIPFSLVMKASASGIMGEWLSYSLLLFYWPIRHHAAEGPETLNRILHVIIVIGLFVLVRNLLEYRSTLDNAEYAWEVARGRAVTNESLLMVASFVALLFALQGKRLLIRMSYLGLFLALYGGLILTQSRAYWVASALGLGVMFLFLPKAQKTRLLIYATTSVIGIGIIAQIVLGDLVTLVATGFFYRLKSLLTATTMDPSLVNRFLESRSVWGYIMESPILGYGMGISYRFYDITYDFSMVRSFVHNGYVALLFKFGLWGFALMMTFLISTVRRSWLTVRKKTADSPYHRTAILVLGSFAALAVTANTANPFFQNDLMFIYAVLLGLSGAAYRNALGQKEQSDQTGA